MKKHLLMIMLAVAVLFTGCNKNNPDEDKKDDGTTTETIKVSLSVTGIANNQATISASLSEGTFYGAKIVEAVASNTVNIDYTSEVKLINYVKENGVDIDLPYTNTLTGLKAETEMFTAVIVYDSNGSAVNSAYQIWTAEGQPTGWSDDNSAGNLEEIDW